MIKPLHKTHNLVRRAASTILQHMVVSAAILIVMVALGTGAYAAWLSPAPPSQPSSQTYTLQQICDHLTTGAAVTPMSAFTEPATGPASTMCTLNTLMGLAPGLDNTNGATTSDVAAGKTFWGIRSGAGRGPLTGIAAAPPPGLVSKTGQTTSYAAGDDGTLQTGVAWPSPRFTDNANGTVTDNLTTLIWLKNAFCFAGSTWALALTSASGLATGSCGLTDGSTAGQWRLPNITEMESLVDLGKATAPRIPAGHPFTSVQSNSYWSSSTYAPNTAYAWYVSLSDGSTTFYTKTNTYYVWPVRAGQ